MKRMKLLTVVGIMLVAFAGLSGAAEAKKPKAGLTVMLDSYEPNHDGFAGPVKTQILPVESRWVAVVQGAVSYYEASQYTEPTAPWKVVCGTPDFAGPLFASPHVPSGGPAGMDAEFVFGRPGTKRFCRSRTWPTKWNNFEIKTGSTWNHWSPLGPDILAPTADHTYSYPLIGWGAPAQFRLKDRPGTWDNYGQMKIALRPATAADCGNYDWHTFEYESQAACEVALGGGPVSTLQ